MTGAGPAFTAKFKQMRNRASELLLPRVSICHRTLLPHTPFSAKHCPESGAQGAEPRGFAQRNAGRVCEGCVSIFPSEIRKSPKIPEKPMKPA